MHVFCDIHIKYGSMLQSGFQQLEDPLPFQMSLFVEGTQFTQEKLLAAQNYASSRGLPIPKNVLIPRTKVNSAENFAKNFILDHFWSYKHMLFFFFFKK
jgi:hypothetical protein